jgi:DNA-binding IclR family transcriptional regulator
MMTIEDGGAMNKESMTMQTDTQPVDMILVPRGLIGAALGLISHHKLPETNTARMLRECSMRPAATQNAAANEIEALRAALTRLRDCDWVISLPDRMDAVRNIARAALGDAK